METVGKVLMGLSLLGMIGVLFSSAFITILSVFGFIGLLILFVIGFVVWCGYDAHDEPYDYHS